VENLPTRFPEIIFPAIDRTPKRRVPAAIRALLRYFFILANPRKSVARIFLNCTKNTELTARLFARTFFFAHSIKIHREIGMKTVIVRTKNLI
jgi:hypothetical protein